jgi:dUTP pyrophosphatase
MAMGEGAARRHGWRRGRAAAPGPDDGMVRWWWPAEARPAGWTGAGSATVRATRAYRRQGEAVSAIQPPVGRVVLEVQRMDPDLPLPAYAHPGDAGLDLVAARDVELGPGGRAAVPTGLIVAVPEGWVGLVHPRSGLARRHGITVANAPGTIDSGYRGELQVLLVNLGDEVVALSRGDRIAQLLIQPVGHAEVVEVPSFEATQRGEGGFGSTGLGSA